MKVLTVIAHPQPKSFCHAVLRSFTAGLREAGHESEVVDLYAIGFDPVFRTMDFASYVHESMPLEILEMMKLKQHVLDSAKGPLLRFAASLLAAQQGSPGRGEIHPQPPAQGCHCPMGKS